METKTFKDLKSEVWDTELCSGCGGACVAVCPADALRFAPGGNTDAPVNIGYCKADNDGVPAGGVLRGLPADRYRNAGGEDARVLPGYRCGPVGLPG